jgi:hypothetical protein
MHAVENADTPGPNIQQKNRAIRLEAAVFQTATEPVRFKHPLGITARSRLIRQAEPSFAWN